GPLAAACQDTALAEGVGLGDGTGQAERLGLDAGVLGLLGHQRGGVLDGGEVGPDAADAAGARQLLVGAPMPGALPAGAEARRAVAHLAVLVGLARQAPGAQRVTACGPVGAQEVAVLRVEAAGGHDWLPFMARIWPMMVSACWSVKPSSVRAMN